MGAAVTYASKTEGRKTTRWVTWRLESESAEFQ